MAKKEGNWFKRHKVWTGILGLIVLIVLIQAVSSGSETTDQSADNSNAATTTEAQKVAKIGQPARDGKFEFTVKSVECGKTRVGDEFLHTDAQGEFCFVNTTIENIGKEAQNLFADDQFVYDAKGNRYSADSEASIYHSDKGSTWYDKINPGNTVSGAIIFDVPKGTKLVSAELHDSAFSGGVKIDLQ